MFTPPSRPIRLVRDRLEECGESAGEAANDNTRTWHVKKGGCGTVEEACQVSIQRLEVSNLDLIQTHL